MVLPIDEPVLYLAYEDPALFKTCDRLFSGSREFIVVCDYAMAGKCRAAADAFLEFEIRRRRYLARLKYLPKYGLLALRAARITMICYLAVNRRWSIELRNIENHIILVKPTAQSRVIDCAR